jgi:hypothetical protein
MYHKNPKYADFIDDYRYYLIKKYRIYEFFIALFNYFAQLPENVDSKVTHIKLYHLFRLHLKEQIKLKNNYDIYLKRLDYSKFKGLVEIGLLRLNKYPSDLFNKYYKLTGTPKQHFNVVTIEDFYVEGYRQFKFRPSNHDKITEYLIFIFRHVIKNVQAEN